MNALEQLYEEIDGNTHKDFRLFMSLKPFTEFPTSLL